MRRCVVSDDIVTRLRECVVGDPDEYTWWQTMTQAATEIERLRAEVRELRALREACKEHHSE